jgi:hypothetical protein
VFSKLDGQRRFVAPLLPAPLDEDGNTLDITRLVAILRRLGIATGDD